MTQPFQYETRDGTLYIVPMRRRWFRWLLTHPICQHRGHRWQLRIPPHQTFRSRTMCRCRRCGLLRWQW